jgi:hypothetical protein
MTKLNDTKPSTFQFINIIDEWKKTYHVNARGEIVFQNKESLANVRFDNHSFHNISKNSRGVENLPETIQQPTEIWMRWEDEIKQDVVLRNYILTGSNFSYICQTRAGVVVNGLTVVNSRVDKYRKGLLFLK